MTFEKLANDVGPNEDIMQNAKKVTDFVNENIVNAQSIEDVVTILNDAQELSISLGAEEAVFMDEEYGELRYFPAGTDRKDVSSYFEFIKAQARGESAGYEDGGAYLPLSVRSKLIELAEANK